MIGRTLSFYIAMKFTRTVLAMLVSLLALIIVVDFVEQLRRAAERPEIPVSTLLQLAALKAPAFMEKAFPFGCLFATMITLAQLNQKLELVVARAAGVSAWQFLLPVSAAAAVLGLFAALIYNPVAVGALQQSMHLETRLFDRHERLKEAKESEYWLRQEDANGSSVINARIARDSGRMLDDLRIIRFDHDGRIYERIDADSAVFDDGRWELANAFVTDDRTRTVNHERYEIDSRLTDEILEGVTASPDSVPFWKLRSTAAKAVLAGGNPDPYIVQFFSLLALPLLMVAMVVIAATVSLRFVRFGQIGRMILGGILCGFVLYTVSKLVMSLGSNGIVPPVIAAWSPALVAIVFGVSVLLHQEDG
jgi:lipopolysaccharide export system permease protein